MGKKKKIIILVQIYLVTIIFGLSGCSFFEAKITSNTAEIVTNVFTESSQTLENPYMGWIEREYNFDSISTNGNLVLASVLWSEIEPQKGQYNFDEFEKNIHYSEWLAKGYKFLFSISMDRPRKDTIEQGLPDWLLTEINNEGTYYKTEDNIVGFSPNYRNTKLIEYHKLLVEKFAERYDNEKTFLFQIGSVGHWGELHTTYIKDKNEIGYYPDAEIENKYFQPYIDYFENCYLCIRLPKQVAIDNNMGLYNHALGNTKHTYKWFYDYYTNGYVNSFTEAWTPAYPDFWKVAPSGGEFLTWPGTLYIQEDTIDDTIKQIIDTHVSWIMALPYDKISGNELYNRNLDKILRNMGYRLVLKSISYKSMIVAGQPLDINMKWENTGIAPCYFNWPIEISLTDLDGNIVATSKKDIDLKSWLPGTKSFRISLIIPDYIPLGKYTINTAFIDPDTAKPGISLAFNTTSENKRYVIGEVEIVKN